MAPVSHSDAVITVRRALGKLMNGDRLVRDEAQAVFDALLDEQVPPALSGAFLVALRMRGESQAELEGAVLALQAHSIRVPCSRRPLMDTCGTGGDGAGTFNVSTAVAFVVAGAGLGVAKHGNRSVSSRCGSADVLEALGVAIDISPEKAARSIDDIGMAFLFAPRYHPAMAQVALIRRALGVPTLFNTIGPLLNPARPEVQFVGTTSPERARSMAVVLGALGVQKAAVASGPEGLDELLPGAENRVFRWHNGALQEEMWDGRDLGLQSVRIADIKGDDAVTNARILEHILHGESGPARDVVLFNAGAALWIADHAPSLQAAVQMAADSIDSGAAHRILERLRGL